MSSFSTYTPMDENGDTMSTIFSDTMDMTNHDNRYANASESTEQTKNSSNVNLSSPTKGFGPIYGQWLGSFVSPFAQSEAMVSPNASQMSFSLVSPCPISPSNPQDDSSLTNNTLFPRGEYLSLLFSPNIFSPNPKASNHHDINNNLSSSSSTSSSSSSVAPMRAEKLSSFLNQNSITPKSLYDQVYQNSNVVTSSTSSSSSSSISSSMQPEHMYDAPIERTGRSRKKVIMETYSKQESANHNNNPVSRSPGVTLSSNNHHASMNNSPAGSDESGMVMFKSTMQASPDRPNKCNCKKSKCLKLYCECFQAMRLCNQCNCMDCYNDTKHNDARLEAIKQVKEKNHTAFQEKIIDDGHASGCHCKQSKCLKKYCECFHAGAFCAQNCKCKSCSNFDGSKELTNIRQVSHEKKQLQVKLQSSVAMASGGGGSIHNNNQHMMVPIIPSSTTTTNIILDMKLEHPTKRKESPTSITNILEALSPGPFNTTSIDMPDTHTTPHPHTIASSRSNNSIITTSSLSSPMMINDGMISSAMNMMHPHVLCVDGIATIPRSSRRRPNQMLSPVFSMPLPVAPITRSKRSIEPETIAPRVINLRSLSSSSPSSIPKSINSQHRYQQQQPHHHAQPLKKRKVKPPVQDFVYDFFGPTNPKVPKVLALRCLEFLGGKDYYSLSVTSSLWSAAATDDALWYPS